MGENYEKDITNNSFTPRITSYNVCYTKLLRSFALSNIFAPILMDMGDKGGAKELIQRDLGFRSGVYMYKGVLTSEVLGKVFDLKYKDIELLLMGMK